MPIVSSPASPGQGSGPRPGIDQPPPLPPNLKTPDVSTIAGNYGQGGSPPTGELGTMVLQQGMLLEKVATSLAQMLPSFAPAAAQIQQILRASLIQSLQSAQQSSGPPGGPQGGGMPPPPSPAGAAGPPPGPPQGQG